LSFAFDLPLSGELVRLVQATVSPPIIVLGVLALLALLLAVALVGLRALRLAERGLGSRQGRAALAGALLVTILASPVAGIGDRRLGAFAASALPAMLRESLFCLRLDRHRAVQTAAVEAAAERLRAGPGLEKLGGAPVLIFLVESYGETVVERPEHARVIEPVYRSLEATLTGHGFSVATGLLDSPTYAGRSWFAQETLFTGARVADRIADEIVQRRQPPTMATVFRRAGYRTVFAQPANRFRGLSRWAYDFEFSYAGWDLGYQGPSFGFANMPDQLAVDFLHRHEVGPARGPLLVAYALQSSHSPWSEQPPFVEDWSRLGDGTVYRSLPIERFPVTWNTLAAGGPAYLRSVAYDLRVLTDYLVRFARPDTLAIILGDHQPVAEVTGGSLSHAVPAHVVSRSAALVAPFLARGYVPGLRPQRGGPPPGLETFLPDLLADFSN